MYAEKATTWDMVALNPGARFFVASSAQPEGLAIFCMSYVFYFLELKTNGRACLCL